MTLRRIRAPARIATLVCCLFPVAARGQTADKTIYVDDNSSCVWNQGPPCDQSPCGTCWESAYKYLEQAIACTDTDLGTTEQIWVARGTYKPATCPSPPCGTGHSYRSKTFSLKKGVRLYGGFVGNEVHVAERPLDPDPITIDSTTDSVLSGDLNGDDVGTDPEHSSRFENIRHVVTGNGTDRSAIIDGFTITGGCDENTGYQDGGAGIRLESNSRAIIRNCSLIGNKADQAGGGIFLRADTGQAGTGTWIVNSVMVGNVAGVGGGIASIGQFNHRVFNCEILGNKAISQAGGVYLVDALQDSDTLFVNTLIAGNYIGEVWGNSGEGGGLYTNGTLNVNVNIRLANCTVTNNAALVGGGLMATYKANVFLHNSIVYGNVSDSRGSQIDVFDLDSGSVEVRFSNVRRRRTCIGGANHRRLCTTVADCPGPPVTYCRDPIGICVGGTHNEWQCESHCPFSTCVNGTCQGGVDIYKSCCVGGTCVGGDVFDYVTNKVDTDAAGAGNQLNNDPLFADPDGFDNNLFTYQDNNFSLQGSLAGLSPCIDAADALRVPGDEVDVDQNNVTSGPTPVDVFNSPRFSLNGGAPDSGQPTNCRITDMGAFEHRGPFDLWRAFPAVYDRNRYITIVPGGHGDGEYAISVRFLALQHPNPPNSVSYPAPDFSGCENEVRWLGPPQSFQGCGSTFWAARLQTTPHWRNDWQSSTSLNVYGEEIVPSSICLFQGIEKELYDTCGLAYATSSGGHDNVFRTQRWGDVVYPFQNPEGACGLRDHPDAMDVTAVVNAFSCSSGDIPRVQAQLFRSLLKPDISVDALDIVAAVDAFRGVQYYWNPPASCTP